jgi:hypothetical protein
MSRCAGGADDGKDLVISRDYISRGFRHPRCRAGNIETWSPQRAGDPLGPGKGSGGGALDQSGPILTEGPQNTKKTAAVQITERALNCVKSFVFIPQLTIRLGRMRNISGSKPGPSFSPRVGSTSAWPRISIPRTVHGFADTTSSMTKATRGLLRTSLYFFLFANPRVVYQIGGETKFAQADIAPRGLRDRLWEKLTTKFKGYLEYRRRPRGSFQWSSFVQFRRARYHT